MERTTITPYTWPGLALALSTLVLLATGSGPWSAALVTAQAPPAEQANQLRELAEQLLAPQFGGPGDQLPTIRLLVGELPPDLPLALPMPPGGRLIGSAVQVTSGRTDSMNVVLEARGTPGDVLSFYEQALARLNWSPPPSGGGSAGGFQPTVGPTSQTFCQGPSGSWLDMTVTGRAAGPTGVRFNVWLSGGGPCGPIEQPGPSGMLGANPMPRLYAPQGVQLQNTTLGSGPTRWTSEAAAETARSTAELEAEFAQQLEGRSWVRQAGQAQGPLAWSIWQVPGEGTWQGTLIAVDAPVPNLRYLSLRLESPTPAEEPPVP